MATTILIVCPECDKQIKAPDNVLGKKVRCKFCQAAFVASKAGVAPPKPSAPRTCPACQAPLRGGAMSCLECGHMIGESAVARPAKPPAGKAPAPKPPTGKPAKPAVDDDEDDDGNPYGMIDVDLAPRCPNCAHEMESEDDVVCLNCGYNTQTREQFQTRKVHDLTGGEHFIWLLPGIACVLAMLIVIGFDIWYLMKIDDLVDPDSWYSSMWAHGGIKLWVVLMSLFALYLAGKFAVKRLILHPKPPEIEKKK